MRGGVHRRHRHEATSTGDLAIGIHQPALVDLARTKVFQAVRRTSKEFLLVLPQIVVPQMQLK